MTSFAATYGHARAQLWAAMPRVKGVGLPVFSAITPNDAQDGSTWRGPV
jgi:hypothetical protein